MAKGDSLTRYQQGIVNRYYEHLDTASLQKLGELVSDLYLCEPHESKATRLWNSVPNLLAKLGIEAERAARIAADRNVETLAKLVNELSNPAKKKDAKAAAAAAPAPTTPAASSSPTTQSTPAPRPSTPATGPRTADPTSPETLKSALKAFRKRLKLTRLDEESKLGRSPLSSGGKSNIVAITPPTQFPAAVWEELVKQNKLKPAGRGFYELVE